MIASKVSGKPFPALMNELIKDVGLDNTYYAENVYPKDITKRMVSGYYYNLVDDHLNRLVVEGRSDPSCSLGSKTRDIKCNDMSWAGASGAIVSSPSDVSKWARELYTAQSASAHHKGILSTKSLADLKSFISVPQGKPLEGDLHEKNTLGFGLGICTAYDPQLGGTYYGYQGITIGYRVYYAYFPENLKQPNGRRLIITIAMNSQPVDCANHIKQLMNNIYVEYKKTYSNN